MLSTIRFNERSTPLKKKLNERTERSIRHAITTLYCKMQELSEEAMIERQDIWEHCKNLSVLIGEKLQDDPPPASSTYQLINFPYFYR